MEARYNNLHQPHFETLDDMEEYAEQVHSSILYCLYDIIRSISKPLTKKEQEKIEYCVSHIGVAYGITLLLRGYSGHLSQGTCVIPKDIMNKHGCTLDQLIIYTNQYVNNNTLNTLSPHEDTCTSCFHDVASQAHSHLEKGLLLQKELLHMNIVCNQPNYNHLPDFPSQLYLLLLPALRTSIYLQLCLTYQFHINHPYILQSEVQFKELIIKLLKTLWYKCIHI